MFKQKEKFKGEGEMAALQRDLDVEGRQRLMPLFLCVFCFCWENVYVFIRESLTRYLLTFAG